MEYRGYSFYTREKPSEEGILRDSEKVVEFVLKEMAVKREKVVIMGRSIGSGPAVHISTKFRVAACVLISPFTSIRGVVDHMSWGIGGWLIKDAFCNLEKIEGALCPFLLIHGAKDKVVPSFHSDKLYGRIRFILR